MSVTHKQGSSCTWSSRTLSQWLGGTIGTQARADQQLSQRHTRVNPLDPDMLLSQPLFHAQLLLACVTKTRKQTITLFSTEKAAWPGASVLKRDLREAKQ